MVGLFLPCANLYPDFNILDTGIRKAKAQIDLYSLQTSIEYAVPTARIGLVIGRGGETINEINLKSGANASISTESEHRNDMQRFITISGAHDQIENAKRMIDEVVKSGQLGGASEEIFVNNERVLIVEYFLCLFSVARILYLHVLWPTLHFSFFFFKRLFSNGRDY
jgi:polyribonucleotide nucleotidyltransferase